jgi:hypothetical protein
MIDKNNGTAAKLNELHRGQIKNVNFICASVLNNYYCIALLEDAEREYGEIIYHTNMRWLRRGVNF